MTEPTQRQKAILHAIHQALYRSLVLLERGWDAPLGAIADDARTALRRAWVATHGPLYDDVIPDAEAERKMFSLWMRDQAWEIEGSDAADWFVGLRASASTLDAASKTWPVALESDANRCGCGAECRDLHNCRYLRP